MYTSWVQERTSVVFSDFYKTCWVTIKVFYQVIEISSYVDFEQFKKPSVVPNRIKSLTKIYEASI